MLASERRNKILEQLQRQGQISTQTLVKTFEVSEDTVRRDLKELSESGLIKKVHGGAVLTSPVPYTHQERQNLNVASKSAIASQAARLIKERMMVFIDGSTTALQLINHIPQDLRATFITHSPLMAQTLNQLPSVEIILMGGKLVKDLLITQAPDSQLIARRYRPDLSIISAHGVNRDAGATVESFEDASIKREFASNSGELVVMAGREKLGFVATYQIAEIDAISYLITDGSKEELSVFDSDNLTIIRVDG